MYPKNILRTILIIAILITTISCDQISKNIVRQRINYYEEIRFLDNHLTLTKVENSGAFLSIGTSLPEPLKIFSLTFLPVLVLSLATLFLLTQTRLPKIKVLGMCFVIGGGVGNIYDRVMYGSVTDFMHIDFGLFQTGVFNMADVSIMTGMFIVLGEMYFKRQGKNFSNVTE